MKGKTYDIKKISDNGNFDTSVADKFYYNKQEYFDALTDFVTDYDQDLRNYTPAFVINSDADREEFLKECYKIRAAFTRLGLKTLLEILSVMEDAAISKKFNEFKDGQINFHATINICKTALKEFEMRWKLKH
jgi:hypothetical protein